MIQTQFEGFSLSERILRALAEEGYQTPTEIQHEAIPVLMTGRDLLATARTGTGKTAAFALPMLHALHANPSDGPRSIRALILTPTRELALQIDTNLRAYGRHLPLRSTVVVGGVSMGAQIRALQRNPEIVVATPGRLLDLMGQGFCRLDRVEMLVLDEADRMLDMGFLPAVKRIVARVPQNRQTMLFSATLSREIGELAAQLLNDPVRVAVSAPASVSLQIEQQVFFVEQENKRALLSGMIRELNIQKALVFTRTKHRADRVMRALEEEGITADSIHSNKSQNARQRSLAAFDRGKVRVLVATDIVSRGIDVEGISHVFNFELPNEPESYVHRIGRTARAGAAGVAVSFCSGEEVAYLKDIEQLTKSPLTADEDDQIHSAATATLYKTHGLSGRSGKSRAGYGNSYRQEQRPQRQYGRASRGRR